MIFFDSHSRTRAVCRRTTLAAAVAWSIVAAAQAQGVAKAEPARASEPRAQNTNQTSSQSANQTSSQASNSITPASLPDIRTLMLDVSAHQKQLEKVRENYTYRSTAIIEDIDADGHVKKTESGENEVFFVNTHRIERAVKKDGKPLSDHDQQKEQERVMKLVEKAQTVPPGTSIEGPNVNVSITQLLEIMQVSNPRRVNFRGRSTIVFDFAGRHDAKTHGMAEDASKKIAGTLWVDELDYQVARMEAHFTDNFHVGGGLLANVAKGSSFYFDQAPVNGEIWFPTGAEGRIEARVLLLKGVRQHIVEHDYDYERFSVDAQPAKPEKSDKPKPDKSDKPAQ